MTNLSQRSGLADAERSGVIAISDCVELVEAACNLPEAVRFRGQIALGRGGLRFWGLCSANGLGRESRYDRFGLDRLLRGHRIRSLVLGVSVSQILVQVYVMRTNWQG